jgi:hypothetical protein
MENKIPTAEEFFEKGGTYPELAIEFAKLHVKAALESATNNVRLSKNGSDLPYGEHHSEKCGTWTVNKKFITEAYPLENIK